MTDTIGIVGFVIEKEKFFYVHVVLALSIKNVLKSLLKIFQKILFVTAAR